MKKIILFLLFCFFSGISVFSQGFQIQGKWKFIADDKMEFCKVEFNDTDWIELETLRWKDDLNKTANRVIWIRKTVIIPSSQRKEVEKTGILTLSMGKIQQSDNTYLNGKLIGSTGSGDSYRNYLIRKDDILWDQANQIAIRVGHWGAFSISATPRLVAAGPEHFFLFGSGLKNGDANASVLGKELIYQFTVVNKSFKSVDGLARADFYDFGGKKIYTADKKVSLDVGNSAIEFPFKSSSPFVLIRYSLSVPDYHYTGEWNGEYGFDNLIYRSVLPVVPYKAKQNYLLADAGQTGGTITTWLPIKK